jgi:hypothetical protein
VVESALVGDPQRHVVSDPWTRRFGFIVRRAKQVDCHGGCRCAILEAEYGAVAAVRLEAEYIDEETRCVLIPFYLDFDRSNFDDRVRLFRGSEGIPGESGPEVCSTRARFRPSGSVKQRCFSPTARANPSTGTRLEINRFLRSPMERRGMENVTAVTWPVPERPGAAPSRMKNAKRPA